LGTNEKNGRIRRVIIASTISIAAIAVIFKFTETSITWKAISEANIGLLFIALLFHTFFWIFWALRLKFLASLLDHSVTYIHSLRTTLASNFLAAITPSSAGGEPLRVKMLSDAGMSYGSATAVVLAERLLDAVFFITALPVFLLLSDFSIGFGLKVGGIFLIFLALFIIFLWELLKRPDRIERLLNWAKRKSGNGRIIRAIEREVWMFRDAAIELAKDSKAQLSALFTITALIWLSEFLVPSFLLLSLSENPNFLYSITSQLIIVIISLIPLTPGSSGIAEFSMSYLYSQFVPQHVLGVLVGMWRGITYFTNLMIGAIFIGFINGFVNPTNSRNSELKKE
jgi:hypothetical protein